MALEPGSSVRDLERPSVPLLDYREYKDPLLTLDECAVLVVSLTAGSQIMFHLL